MGFSSQKAPFTGAMISAIGALVTFSACNGAPGIAEASAPGANGGSSNASGAGSGQAVVGESCQGGGKTCLGMHFVSYKNSAGKSVTTPAQVATIIHTTNQVWAQ